MQNYHINGESKDTKTAKKEIDEDRFRDRIKTK